MDQLETKAREAAKRDAEAYFPANKPGALMVCWDEAFEYYELSARGEPISIDRDEAIDLLNDLMFKAAKKPAAVALENIGLDHFRVVRRH